MIKNSGLFKFAFVFVAVLFFCVPLSIADDFKHHVIVLIDRSNPMDASQNRRAAIDKLVTEVLEDVCFQKDTIVSGRKLLDQTKGDYLSIISFGMTRRPDFLDFIQTVKDVNGIEYNYRQDFSEGMFQTGELLNAIKNYDDFFNFHWSAISLSMPMGIYHIGRPNDNIQVHRTFLILITDEDYAGLADAVLELDLIERTSRFEGFEVQHSLEARNIFKNIRSTLFWNKVPENDPYEKELGEKPITIKLKVYEFTPIAKIFAIESLIQYDIRRIDFMRVKGGYASEFKIAPINQGSSLHVQKINIKLVDDSNQIINNNQVTLANVTANNTIKFNLNHHYADVADRLKLVMNFWVHWKNDIYGVHVLHPEGSPLQGSKGLNRELKVEFEPTLKVWGVLPLINSFYDFSTSFLGDSQIRIQNFWEAAIAFFAIAIIGFFFIWFIIRLILRLKKELETEGPKDDNEIKYT